MGEEIYECTSQEIAEWRALRSQGMTSAVGEYTPAEFWSALDVIESLRAEAAENARIIGMGAEREAALRAQVEALQVDGERLDWLEVEANTRGGIRLHSDPPSGSDDPWRRIQKGLGLLGWADSPRSLRAAIDAAKGEPSCR